MQNIEFRTNRKFVIILVLFMLIIMLSACSNNKNDMSKTGHNSDEDYTLMDVTGRSSEELAEEIRFQLKSKYPTLYSHYWGNKNICLGAYYEYYNSIDPSDLEFVVREDGLIDIYDTWGLDYATNSCGYAVYVTIEM